MYSYCSALLCVAVVVCLTFQSHRPSSSSILVIIIATVMVITVIIVIVVNSPRGWGRVGRAACSLIWVCMALKGVEFWPFLTEIGHRGFWFQIRCGLCPVVLNWL